VRFLCVVVTHMRPTVSPDMAPAKQMHTVAAMKYAQNMLLPGST
jgi:hypothetical protein